MEIFSIIDGINARKNALGMTNQQIADASQVPKSTVDRVLRKDTENPTMKVILDIANAVGYDFSTRNVAAAPEIAQESPYVRHIISLYEGRIASMEQQYNRVTAEKNRWIKTLALIVAILVAGIMFILIYDITHPDLGWFQREAYHSFSGLGDIFMATKSWFKTICANIGP